MSLVNCSESCIPELSSHPQRKGKAHLPGSRDGDVRTVWNDSRRRMNMIWKDGKHHSHLPGGSLKDYTSVWKLSILGHNLESSSEQGHARSIVARRLFISFRHVPWGQMACASFAAYCSILAS